MERCLSVRRSHPTWGPVKVRAYLERWRAEDRLAGREHDRGAVRPRGPDGEAQACAGVVRPSSVPFAALRSAQRRLVHRLQRLVPHRRRHPLRAADAERCRQPLSVALPGHGTHRHGTCLAGVGCSVPRVRPAQGVALRQRSSPLPRPGRAGCRELSVKVIKAGVLPERIAPGKPQQNGRLERLHLTLLQDTADPPACSLRQQMERFHDFQRVYNEERPHQALGNDTPADHYTVSPRRWDGVLRAPEYANRRHRSGGCATMARSSGRATRSTSARP